MSRFRSTHRTLGPGKLVRSILVLVVTAALAGAGVALASVSKSAGTVNVTVVISDKGLQLSNTNLVQGAIAFKAINQGKKSHAFQISGSGLGTVKTPTLKPGQSQTVVVSLKAAKYTMWDPISLGKSKSISLVVKAEAAGSGGGGSSSSGSVGKIVTKAVTCSEDTETCG
jgi:hypothetical protein